MAKRRVGRMVGTSWVLATAVTGLVVWRAVAVLDDGTRTDVLSGAQVSGLLQSAASASSTNASASSVTIPPAPTESAPTLSTTAPETTAATTTTPPKTSLPTTKPPAATQTPVVRTWTVTGGVTSVACTGQVISLLSASPKDGWRVKIEGRGPDQVKLEFVTGEREVKLTATCVGGLPSQTIVED
ncbi:MAG: hypothetical protein ACOH16_12785 [Propionibacteriaceae bacterium]